MTWTFERSPSCGCGPGPGGFPGAGPQLLHRWGRHGGTASALTLEEAAQRRDPVEVSGWINTTKQDRAEAEAESRRVTACSHRRRSTTPSKPSEATSR